MSATFLLVEDNPSDQKLLTLAFGRLGLPEELVVKGDGADALAWLLGDGRAPPGPLPRVVLLDLSLPRVDGFEVLRRIRADARTRHLPVVMLTSSREEEDIQRCYALGANAYVGKPVDFGDFVEAARAMAQFWLVHNDAPGRGRA